MTPKKIKYPKNFKKKTDAEKSAWVLHKIFRYKRKEAKPFGEQIAGAMKYSLSHHHIDDVDLEVLGRLNAKYPNAHGLPPKSFEVLYDYVKKKG